MNYYDENRLCTVNEFYENAKKQKKALKKAGVSSEQELEEKRALLLGAQFTSAKYIEMNQESPSEYPDVSPADMMDELEYIDAVHDYMMQNGDGDSILNNYPLVSAAIMVKKSHSEIVNAGIDSDITERIVHAVVPAIEAVTLKAIKHAPQFNIGASNVINAQKVLKRYPEITKMMTDEATRTVFTNKAERNQWTPFTVHNGKTQAPASILLSQSIMADPANKVLIESKFSIYDWVVMEAVATLYDYAETNNELDSNGTIAIDIKSIDKILKRDILSRMSKEAQNNITSSDIVKSLVKLMGNHVNINDSAGCFEGDMVDGELAFVKGILCVVVKSKPVLFKYADENGRNHIESIMMDDLKLHTSNHKVIYTTEVIAIYRYLLSRLKEIYGSYKMDSQHMKPKSNYSNSVPLENIINAVYPEGLGQFKDQTSKRRYILSNIEKVCKAMEHKKIFFNKYEQGQNSKGDRVFIFHRN